MYFISIIEKLMIIYFTLYVIIDVLLYLHALSVFRFGRTRKQSIEVEPGSKKPKVSIIVPAYNEEVSIVTCVKMLLKLNYENYQLIVVNDGSRDSTLDQMLSNFVFVNVSNSEERSDLIRTAMMKQIYVSESGKLLLIDKENGGKADAINTAINLAEGEYICTIDADSILDSKALEHILQPFLEDDSVFVSGGQIALSNDLLIENNRVVSAKMPRKWIVLWQILEYISTFMVARISMSRINALIIMSGAFSMFRKADLMAVGGFLTKINDHPYILKHLGRVNRFLRKTWKLFSGSGNI
jgi:cellulose synthase/poly-beta-1,6-N-acetylglucosamine synthase-like glycosyltransferase